MPCGCARNVISGREHEQLALADGGFDDLRRRRSGSSAPTPSRCGAAPALSNQATGRTPLSIACGPSANTGLLSKNTSTLVVEAVRDRRRVVDRHAQHRSGHVVLLGRQRPMARRRPSARRDGCRPAGRASCARLGGGSTDREDRAAVLDELLELRAGLRRGVGPSHRPVLRRNVAVGSSTSAAASAACRRRHPARPPPPAGPTPDGKMITSNLAGEVARVERLRIDDLERELELLEEQARPARRHRAAVLIRERDSHASAA